MTWQVVELLRMLSSVGNAKSRKFASMGDLTCLDSGSGESAPAAVSPAPPGYRGAQAPAHAGAHASQRRPRSYMGGALGGEGTLASVRRPST